MSKPTLLVKGNLVSQRNDPKEQKELNEIVPIDYIMDWFKKRKYLSGMENRILILKSDTGSGKSTAFPATLFDNFYEKGTTILCTQPRVLTAIEISKELGESEFYPKLKFGETIGFSTGVTKKKIKSGLMYVTLDTLTVLLKILPDDEFMKKYKYIIVDEVHERSQSLDITLYMLKNFYLRNRNNSKLPFLTLTSATIDPNAYAKYFEVSEIDNIIRVSGFAFSKTIHWLKSPTNNYIRTAAEEAIKIHKNNLDDPPDKCDLMIFLPGEAEMKECIGILDSNLQKLLKKGKKLYRSFIINRQSIDKSTMDYLDLMKPLEEINLIIDKKVYKPSRRIILTTSVAETGLTVPTLKYVVDCGYHRGSEYNPCLSVNGILTKPAARSRIEQRKGRAGRKFPGEFYPLYPENIYLELPKDQFPNILIEDITDNLTTIIKQQLPDLNDPKAIIRGDVPDTEQIFKLANIDLMDVPSPDAFHEALQRLYVLGFIDQDEEFNLKLTTTGILASKFTKITAEHVKLILSGYAWNCYLLDLIAIVSYLNVDLRRRKPTKPINWTYIYRRAVPRIFMEPGGKIPSTTQEKELFKFKMLYADDFIDLLFLFQATKNVVEEEFDEFFDNLEFFCEQANIDINTIMQVFKFRDDLIEECINAGLDPFYGVSLFETHPADVMNVIIKIKYCIYEAYKLNVLTYDPNTTQYKTVNNIPVVVNAIFNEMEEEMSKRQKFGMSYKNKPKMVLYDKLTVKYKKFQKKYKINAVHTSAMDGYIDHDKIL